MASEVTAEVRVQRSIQRFSFVSKTQTTYYSANLRAIDNPHDILTWTIVIPYVDEEQAYPPGTALSVRGRLAPGSKGAMFELHVTEHLRLDRTLNEIPSKALFTAFGEVLAKSHCGEDCLVIQTDPDSPAFFAVLKKHLPELVFDAIDLHDAVRVIGTFNCTLQPYSGDQVLLSLLTQDLAVTGHFSRYHMYENTRSDRSGSTGEASALFVAEDDNVVDDIPSIREDHNISPHVDDEWIPTWRQHQPAVGQPAATGWNLQQHVLDAHTKPPQNDSESSRSSHSTKNGDLAEWSSPVMEPASPLVPSTGAPNVSDRHTVNPTLKRIPDVSRPWSSPIIPLRTLKRRADYDSDEEVSQKRPRWNGSAA